jgi:hypothetical protein
MHALVVPLLLSLAAPEGIVATDAITLLTHSEALISSMNDPSAFKKLYASEAQVFASIKAAARGAPEPMLKEVAKNLVTARAQIQPAPAGFKARHAVVSMDAVNAMVRFVDDAGHAVDFEWIRPGAKGKRLLLLSAPQSFEGSREQLLTYARETAGAQAFIRDESGAWGAMAIEPAPGKAVAPTPAPAPTPVPAPSPQK